MIGPIVMFDGAQFRRSPGHWQIVLAQLLCDDGFDVSYPLLPDLDAPDADEWCRTFRRHLSPDAIVVAHGLSAAWWTRLAADGGPIPASLRVLLVAPPGPGRRPDLTRDLDPALLRSLSVEPPVIVVAQDDPWRNQHPLDLPEDSGVRVITLPTGGHLNEASRLGAWAPAHHWVLTGQWPDPPDDAPAPMRTPITNAADPPDLADALVRRHRPHGRRLGIAVTPAVSANLVEQVAATLTDAGVTPARRLALIPLPPTRESVDANEIKYFLDRYGHEYTTIICTDAEVPDAAPLHDPLTAVGCHLIRVPATTD
ncbi:alpha/beta hydrolase [Gordonia rubripertincta]|uniref:Alpha/beta hydrolase n=1 Tax=Gordonia rubripertincta TaxID=36822 RepID=A0AAW4G2Z0_GORRU|nr:alpha/beta hydrolase [Gordonia rubripertincta]MBM7277470.1 alpha/beta hydrolase [Gordonia rubripertincta]